MARYLLDTHVFLWSYQEKQKLTEEMIKILSNAHHEFYLSMASIWEIQIKVQLNKLSISPSLDDALVIIEKNNLFKILPIKKAHILNLQNLPLIHKDPFDRMIISQAMTEKLNLLSVDDDVLKYPIDAF